MEFRKKPTVEWRIRRSHQAAWLAALTTVTRYNSSKIATFAKVAIQSLPLKDSRVKIDLKIDLIKLSLRLKDPLAQKCF